MTLVPSDNSNTIFTIVGSVSSSLSGFTLNSSSINVKSSTPGLRSVVITSSSSGVTGSSPSEPCRASSPGSSPSGFDRVVVNPDGFSASYLIVVSAFGHSKTERKIMTT